MLRFIDSFNHYSTTELTRKWTSVLNGTANGMTIYNVGRYGSSSLAYLRALGGGSTSTSYVEKTFTATQTLIAGAAVYIDVKQPNVLTYLISFYDGTTPQCSLGVNPNGTLFIARNNSTILATSTKAISHSAWYYIEFKVTVDNAGSAEIRVNGETWISFSGDTQQSTLAQATSVRVGHVTTGNNGSDRILFADFYLCDSSGSVNNNFLGDIKVEALFPNGEGDSLQWTASGGGTHYTMVDEATPNDDTDYVSSATANQIDLYNLGSLSAGAASVKGVQNNLCARKDDAGARTVCSVLRQGGANYEGSSISVLDGYSYLSTIYDVNPATTNAFSVAEVNGLQAGVKLVS